MRLAVLLVLVGSIALLGFAMLSEQTQHVDNSLANNSTARPAFNTSTAVFNGGARLASLAWPFALAVAVVGGAFALFQGGGGR